MKYDAYITPTIEVLACSKQDIIATSLILEEFGENDFPVIWHPSRYE